MSYIYQVVDLKTHEYYIGMKSNSDPMTDNYWGSGSNRICNSARKHKGAGYRKDVLINNVKDKVLLAQLEKQIIGENYKGGADHDPLCLNLKCGGEGGGVKGRSTSDEHRANLSKALKENHSNHRRHASDETRRKMSESMKGKNKGKFLSVETKAKISETCKRRKPISDETRAKLSESQKKRRETERLRHDT